MKIIDEFYEVGINSQTDLLLLLSKVIVLICHLLYFFFGSTLRFSSRSFSIYYYFIFAHVTWIRMWCRIDSDFLTDISHR